MILATNSLAAAPSAASRQFDLCKSAQAVIYLANVAAVTACASVSQGLSAQRKTAFMRASPVGVPAETVGINASGDASPCLKV